MSDNETNPTQFRMTAEVELDFDAADVVHNLSPLQVRDLVLEIMEQSHEWETLILVARRLSRLAQAAPTDLLASTDAELEAAVADAGSPKSEQAETEAA